EAELARGGVMDGVGVLAFADQGVRVADPDADTVVDRLGLVGLLLPVALDAADVEPHAHLTPILAVKRGEIAQQAVPDAVALGIDAQGLGDLERAIGLDLDLAAPG